MKKTLAPSDITAVIDSREKTPLELASLNVERATLVTGDYSVKGLTDVIAVERKSLQDLAMCVGRERSRFEREILRLLAYPHRLVVVEGSWNDIERGPGLGAWRGAISPNVMKGSILGWMAQGVPFLLAGDHEAAGKLVANFLFVAARKRWREAWTFLEVQETAAGLSARSAHTSPQGASHSLGTPES